MVKWSVMKLIEENPEAYKKMLKKRGRNQNIIEDFIEAKNMLNYLYNKRNELKHELNLLSKEIANSPNKKENILKARDKKTEIKRLETKIKTLSEKYEKILYSLPNIVLPSVPYGGREGGIPISYHGKPMVWRGYIDEFKRENILDNVNYKIIDWKPIGHADMMEKIIKELDTIQAGKVAGSRFYYSFNKLAALELAISIFAISELKRRGYTLVLPPHMLKRDALNSAIDLETFEEMIYKIENEDLYLIGTAEHPLLAYLKNKTINEDELPIKFVGFSPCYRKEAGSHGKDTKGIFRVHQFYKIEQFIFSKPEDSEKHFKELVRNSEDLLKELEIPYRVVNIYAEDLGAHAAIKYDIEAWFPAQGRYREVVSASNVLDWQAFRANIKLRRHDGSKEYIHTLNSTALPVSRTLCAIIENYQTEDATVKIPDKLKKYLKILGFDDDEINFINK